MFFSALVGVVALLNEPSQPDLSLKANDDIKFSAQTDEITSSKDRQHSATGDGVSHEKVKIGHNLRSASGCPQACPNAAFADDTQKRCFRNTQGERGYFCSIQEIFTGDTFELQGTYCDHAVTTKHSDTGSQISDYDQYVHECDDCCSGDVAFIETEPFKGSWEFDDCSVGNENCGQEQVAKCMVSSQLHNCNLRVKPANRVCDCTSTPAVDCVGAYGECNNATCLETYVITTEAANDGTACDAAPTRRCQVDTSCEKAPAAVNKGPEEEGPEEEKPGNKNPTRKSPGSKSSSWSIGASATAMLVVMASI